MAGTSSPLLDVLSAAALATLQYALLSSVGVAGAKYPRTNPLLGPEKVAMLSRLGMTIFYPAWAFSAIGAHVDVAMIRRDWAVAVASAEIKFIFRSFVGLHFLFG